MALSSDGLGARVTSSLNEVRNDTGRVAFCGPFVLSAITGFPVSAVEDRIRAFREIPADRIDGFDAFTPRVKLSKSDEPAKPATKVFGRTRRSYSNRL